MIAGWDCQHGALQTAPGCSSAESPVHAQACVCTEVSAKKPSSTPVFAKGKVCPDVCVTGRWTELHTDRTDYTFNRPTKTCKLVFKGVLTL